MSPAEVNAVTLTNRADGILCAKQIAIAASAAVKPPPKSKFPANKQAPFNLEAFALHTSTDI